LVVFIIVSVMHGHTNIACGDIFEYLNVMYFLCFVIEAEMPCDILESCTLHLV